MILLPYITAKAFLGLVAFALFVIALAAIGAFLESEKKP
jgi:hypothetical protein